MCNACMYRSLLKVGSPLNFHSNMLELGKESPKMEIFHGLPLGVAPPPL